MIYCLIIISIIIFGIFLNILSNKLIINYFDKANNEQSGLGLKSHEVVSYFIEKLKLNLKVQEYGNYLDNSYNINKKVIFLSKDVFNSSSVGAISVSTHELGHALQHKQKSALFYAFCVSIMLNKISSFFIFPCLIFLVVSLFLETIYLKIALIILACIYAINLISRLVVIPLEKNASNKAIKLLKEYSILSKSELKIAKKLLNLACFTYVGGFFKNYRKFFKNILRGF